MANPYQTKKRIRLARQPTGLAGAKTEGCLGVGPLVRQASNPTMSTVEHSGHDGFNGMGQHYGAYYRSPCRRDGSEPNYKTEQTAHNRHQQANSSKSMS